MPLLLLLLLLVADMLLPRATGSGTRTPVAAAAAELLCPLYDAAQHTTILGVVFLPRPRPPPPPPPPMLLA